MTPHLAEVVDAVPSELAEALPFLQAGMEKRQPEQQLLPGVAHAGAHARKVLKGRIGHASVYPGEVRPQALVGFIAQLQADLQDGLWEAHAGAGSQPQPECWIHLNLGRPHVFHNPFKPAWQPLHAFTSIVTIMVRACYMGLCCEDSRDRTAENICSYASMLLCPSASPPRYNKALIRDKWCR